MIDSKKWIGTAEIAKLLGKPRSQIPAWIKVRRKVLGEPKKGMIGHQEAHFWPRPIVMDLIAKGIRKYTLPVQVREILPAYKLPVAIMLKPEPFSAAFMRGGCGA